MENHHQTSSDITLFGTGLNTFIGWHFIVWCFQH